VKILLVHNAYAKFSGEEAVVESTSRMLVEQGHEVLQFTRNSAEIPNMPFGKLRAFYSGIYSLSSKKAMRGLLAEHKPDIVHVHNVFPLISPAILPECNKAGVPVVMTVHNYRLVCPNGLHMTNGKVCEKCCGGKEYQCLLNNCEGSLFKSLGYFLRNYVARKLKLFKNNVMRYACLTKFQKQRLIDAGFAAERLAVIPNMSDMQERKNEDSIGDYIGFIGRISPEKDVATLIKAAKVNSDILFKAAGDYNRMPNLPKEASKNFEFCGHLSGNELRSFYLHSRMFVLPSIWYEGFPNTLLEAMALAKPVVCSRIGGLPEIVDDGVTGLLFEPGNADDLTEKIRYLWDRPQLCRQMGQAGKEKALQEYSPQKYYKRLMAVYEKAIVCGPECPDNDF